MGFFAAFPTYRNEFASVDDRDGLVIMVGRSFCAENSRLEGPAIWTARTVGTLIAKWRAYHDMSAVRRELGVPIS